MKALSLTSVALATLLVVHGASRADTKRCLTGTAPEVAADPAQIAAVRTLIDANCACATFDGTRGKGHRAYVNCAAGIIKSQTEAGAVRTWCKMTVKRQFMAATCGRTAARQPVPCVRTSLTTGRVSCAIKALKNCVGRVGRFTAVACAGSTSCLGAADTNHDLLITAPGDSGACESPCAAQAQPFTSTFQAIQKVVFDGHGCTQPVCHGSSAAGGLNLSTAVAYANLIDVPSTASPFPRVQPGDKDRSLLWLKLAAKTDPTKLPAGFQLPGAPMPNGLPAISANELEALRLWIFSGAPLSGTVGGTQSLLNACMPPPEPITIKPLDPPLPGQGVQFVMPPWDLEAHSEHEICFATYYDFTSQVPAQFRDPTGTLFRFSTQELRQDPQSHHLILNRYIGSASDIHDPSFGVWSCNGGDRDGLLCEPTDLAYCGTGTCTSTIRQSFACLGFGPPGAGATYYSIGGAQKSQAQTVFAPGVFAQIPMKGILYWNSHAFNLTDANTVMHARLNYMFASDDRFPVQGIFDASKIFAADAPPYSTQTLCNDFVLPQGARLFSLSSHTHKRGKHFTVAVPGGALIYESFVYNDPLTATFDPPRAFDSPDVTQRTLHYCSLYNNGVAADGSSPDPETVTRRSRTPQSAFSLCTPMACAAGRIGAPCSGLGDDQTCDTSLNANDGSCDACKITGGESTENEMFILIGQYYLSQSGSAGLVTGVGAAATATKADAAGHSTSTDVVLPAQMGCGSSHQGHAAMQAGSSNP